jgi:hypothetical protein
MAKKKIRRRLKLQEQAAQAEFLKRIKGSAAFKDKEILINPSDRDKMSQALLDFVAPLLADYGSEISVKKIIGVGIMAWNLSLLPEEERRKALIKVTADLSPSAKDLPIMQDILTWLMIRKKTYFDKHQRQIMDYKLSDFGDRYSLQVVAVDVSDHR